MIKTKKDLISILKNEKNIYTKLGYKGFWHYIITNCEVGLIWRYIYYMRKDEYYYNNLEKKIFYIPYILNRRRKNRLGVKLGISIPPNTFEEGITIYHSGNIIINANSIIGKNCKIHGSVCIGNNGITEEAPKLGDNVDIGIGAKIIGNVVIASNCKIGANTVVVESVRKNDSVIVGEKGRVI